MDAGSRGRRRRCSRLLTRPTLGGAGSPGAGQPDFVDEAELPEEDVDEPDEPDEPDDPDDPDESVLVDPFVGPESELLEPLEPEPLDPEEPEPEPELPVPVPRESLR